MTVIAVLANDPEVRATHRAMIQNAGFKVREIFKFGPAEVAEQVNMINPELVVVDCGGTAMSILKELRKSPIRRAYVVVVEDEGSMFLSNLSTPRLQYISTRSRKNKILLAIEYGLDGKSTMQRLQDGDGDE